MMRCLVIASLFFLIGGTPSSGGQESAEFQIKQRFDVRMAMRDGVELSADIWMPVKPGRYPSVLIRTPYLKTSRIASSQLGKAFASRGYVFVVQDVRGRGDSDGKFDFFFNEGKDGYDTVEWMAAQSWSNGKVGMVGISYLGTVQWLAARERPPHLVCIAPGAAAGRYFDEVAYQGGAFLMQPLLTWVNDVSGRISQENVASLDWSPVFKHRPLLTMDEAMGRRMRLYREFLQHDTMDDYWQRIQFTADDFEKIDLPVLHVTGWFDADQPGALSYWDGMRDYSPAKNKQFLLVGPWNHGQTFLGRSGTIGEFEFPKESSVNVVDLDLKFFNHYLKGSADTFDFPRARIYITGAYRWQDFAEYPPANIQRRPFYLHSAGKANSLASEGQLSRERPGEEPADSYTYDPENPVPSDVGKDPFNWGDDLREIEQRKDVLVYTSDVVERPLEVIGRVFVHLHAASDALDTDFTANILDVYPDGRAVKLGSRPAGIIRARYRNGYDRAVLLTPGKSEEFKIELFDIAHSFLPGHRLRIEISSSASPFFHPNPNTGKPVATDTDSRVAHQTIYHDNRRPSHVSLPVLEEW